ncbi:MAG: response regulator [Desulfobacteraceae bacterium]|nr:response regulator [Desulfobacteraceae bacterium]
MITGNRLLLSILLPVILFGITASILLSAYLSPELVDIVSKRTDALLKGMVRIAISACNERSNVLPENRLDSGRKMPVENLDRAIDEIKEQKTNFADIHMMILSNQAVTLGSTLDNPPQNTQHLLEPAWKNDQILRVRLDGRYYYMTHRYYSLWQIHIFALITDSNYMAPVLLAKRIAYYSSFGVMVTVLIFTVLLFTLKVNKPLKNIVRATQRVSQNQLEPIRISSKDEIGEVAIAFNAMVNKLNQDKRQLREIMRELRDSEEQYRILSEYSLTHIAIVQKKRLVFANKSLVTAFGASNKDFYQKELADLIHPEDRQEVIKRIGALENGEKQSDHFECRIQNHLGIVLWLEVLATLALYREKHSVLFHAVNITVRKNLEKKLAQFQKLEAIGTLAGGVAHDLNNILGGLLGYPELLLLDLPQDSALRGPLKHIQQSGQRAAEIVQDLLTLARRGVQVKDVVNLNTIIRAYLNSLEHKKILDEHPDVEFITDLSGKLLNINGSTLHLTKTIMNLSRNAAESIFEEGKVVIKTSNHYTDINSYDDKYGDLSAEGDYVILEVHDSGSGICQNDIERIFEPFYTKKVMGRGGTGLGMSVVLSTVQDHNGRVDVSSYEGQGTKIRLVIPATSEKTAVIVEKAPLDKIMGNGETILVVDDVEEQRRLMSVMLHRIGYSVATVESGEKAVSFIKSDKADLVLLDMVMDPGIDGLETFKQILEINPAQKAVILSGFTEHAKIEEAMRLGIGAYLKKPVVMEQLGQTVQNVLLAENTAVA